MMGGHLFRRPEVRVAAAYAATSFGASILNTLFGVFYLDVYLNVYKLPPNWFYGGHLAFSLWNALNDPLFGYLGDLATSSSDPVPRRLFAIRWGGPLWCLVFLMPWFVWFDVSRSTLVGLHFVAALFLFDTFLTWVLLNQCALIADITSSNEERTLCTQYGALLSIVGNCSVFVGYVVFNGADLSRFRAFAVLAALVACCAFLATATFIPLKTPPVVVSDPESPGKLLRPESPGKLLRRSQSTAEAKPSVGMLTFARQLLRHSNFWLFVSLNFVQVFHSTFNTNFFKIFMDQLLGTHLSASVLSGVILSGFVLPPLLTALVAPLVNTMGYYRAVKLALYFKVALSLVSIAIGMRWPWLVLMMVLNSTLTTTTFSYFNLVLSDIAEEDCVRYQRPHMLSAMFFGSNALFTKPAQSLAPTLGWAMLSRVGYAQGSKPVLSGPAASSLKSAMFGMLVGIPLVCGVVQSLLWSRYTLHGKLLADTKALYQDAKRTADDSDLFSE
eukprot:TRINITY_DN26687_c0_g1_i1.p1 TRINITY_DN26687_c0_g1~~TRINITY_DN26687_c0_g1_i1.p1  ORF type:complete len:500 (-),score=153.20 TRINITY_DN26687_c0_g1_i1:106-1605(-)